MAGACTALRSQSPSSLQQTAEFLPRTSSISRLCFSTNLRPRFLRLRTRAPSSSACFKTAPISGSGLQSSIHLSRKIGTSIAASSEDLASVGAKGTEADFVDESSSKAASNAASSEDAAAGVLRDTTEELKEQAEKARAALTVTAQETAAVLAATAQETAQKSKENLSYIAENAPDPIREIADTALKAHSSDTPKKFAKIHDFCLGIPYGGILVIGGFLWFIISGSTAPIRFGVILGGILLALSVTSLSAWKEGKPTTTYIIGQAVISAILALRQSRRLFEARAFFPAAFFTLISIGMVGFYSYVLIAGGNPPPKKMKEAPAV
ncbi:hypothetical protein GOP47_0012408 [Adiantum capillus-veneris]|uniref:Uncharacterized protein n=1 Tax=Adiantum capillus-veneris TaxID=13818 RepID=A0A9D4UR47_ADICA|nr:hypothetical protein GOP47_0012408 [Adiantum capillus-veneris]